MTDRCAFTKLRGFLLPDTDGNDQGIAGEEEFVDGLHMKCINNIRRHPSGFHEYVLNTKITERKGPLSSSEMSISRATPSSISTIVRTLSVPVSLLPSFRFSTVGRENLRIRMRADGESSLKMKPFREKFAIFDISLTSHICGTPFNISRRQIFYCASMGSGICGY